MTKEEKQLLVKDLCARLPYKVIVEIISYGQEEMRPWFGELSCKDLECFMLDVAYKSMKPYLRQMSSMTEEEFEKLKEYSGLKYEQLDLASFQNGAYKCLDFYLNDVPADVIILVFDWLNAHHFNYRLPNSLFIEAPKEMYKEQNEKVEH